MSDSFADYLNQLQVDSDTLQVAAMYYIAERTEDLSESEMRRQMIDAVGDSQEVDTALATLQGDPVALEGAALLLLSHAWEEPGEAERVRRAIEGAKSKLPVMEIAVIAIVGMYGMYLIATRGRKTYEKETIHHPDGSFEERERTEYYSAVGPLSVILRLFNLLNGE